MSAFDEFPHRNPQFARSEHRPELTAMPSNPVFVVTWLDPRVDPAGFLGVGVWATPISDAGPANAAGSATKN